MPITETQTKVLIIGAGPSGLMMAAQLLRNGVQPVIIDSKDGPTIHSKALAVQARTLEIYRQMGIVDKALADGKRGAGVVFNQNGEKKASLAMGKIGEGLTLYPYILLYPQSKNERLLLDQLTKNSCPVYWNTSLTSLEQKADHVIATIKDSDKEHTLICDWVVGADGAHSLVRKEIQAPFGGDTYANFFYLIDAQLKSAALSGDNFIELFLAKNGFAGFFPMPEKDTYRVIGKLPEQFKGRDDVTVEQVLPELENIIDAHAELVQNNWFTTYKLHHRMAQSFRKQRCFLIGDAAHIHSPVGGQGMNTGLQDAYNLAWKLAGVVNGKLKPVILDSYAAERMPVARALLKTTDAAFNMVNSGNFFAGLFKKFILFRLLNMVWKSEKIKTEFFKVVSQISINYRHSNVNLHLSYSTKVKAGDRLPYIPIFDEKKQTDTDLHEWCSKPGFTLIILGRFEEMFLFTLARWIAQNYQGILNFYYLPPSGKNTAVFDEFGADPHGQKAIIVRPDMYIGYLNDVVDIGIIDNYLRNVVGLVQPPLNLPR
jgi:2-polyprenyl-6-methoxyphenol hydroxylase-like FAD-dependent oxidoreductase